MKLGNAAQPFGSDLGAIPVKDLAEFAPSMRPAIRDRDWITTRARLPGQAIVAGIAVNLQDAVKAGEEFLGIGSQFAGTTAGPEVTLGDAPSDGALHLALETLPSGTVHDERIMPMLIFKDASDRYCREFEVFGDLQDELEFGIACRSDRNTWHVEIMVSAPMGGMDGGGFVPASGPGADALAEMIKALGAGEPLAPAAEASVIESGWQP